MRIALQFLFISLFLGKGIFAQTKPNLGSGTDSDPYQIENLEHLIWVSQGNDDMSETERWSKYYQLVADIDAENTATLNEGKGFSPIGNNTNKFVGVFDGQAFVISNLVINRPNENYIGLFGYSAGKIKNLGIVNVDITGYNYVGAICGRNERLIKKTYSSGTVTGTNKTIGGLVGDNTENDSNDFGASIERSYSSAAVEGVKNIGGLVGGNFKTSKIITCYSTGKVTGTSSDLGGLIGKNSSSEDVQYSYWDTETSGMASSAGEEEPLKTADFTNENKFDSWDFGENNWRIPTYNIVNSSTSRPHIFMYDINTSSVEGHGEIPSSTHLYKRDTLTLSFEPDDGYEITDVTINGENKGAIFVTPNDRTIDNPYQISNLAELRWISEGIEGEETDAERWDKHYILIANIDASETEYWNLEKGFKPIGNNGDGLKFFGSFDGQEFNISNLYINRGEEKYIGLFGYIKGGALIKNLGVTQAAIQGQNFIGILVGKSDNASIEYSYVSGSVTSSNKTVGGLVGDLSGGAVISNTYAFANVAGLTNVGGLVGGNYKSTISDSYAVGTVQGDSNIGGLFGFINADASVVNSYWDTDVSEITDPISDEVGLTTAEFAQESSFPNWNFSSIWKLHTNSGLDENIRPYLFLQEDVESYAVNVKSGKNGYILPKSIEVTKGETVSFEIIPNQGYEINSLLIDGENIEIVSQYTFSDIQADHQIEASFTKALYNLSVIVNGSGSVVSDPVDKNEMYFDEEVNYTFIPDEGFTILDVIVNGESLGRINTLKLNKIYEDQFIEVVFGDFPIYVIPALAGENGRIYPDFAEVTEGESQLFEIIPNAGYEIEEVYINSEPVGVMSEYLFENVSANQTISATFKMKNILDSPDQISFDVYPNPTAGILYIENIVKGKQVQIYSVLGRSIASTISNGQKITFDLSNVDTGVYFIYVEGIGTVKFIKE